MRWLGRPMNRQTDRQTEAITITPFIKWKGNKSPGIEGIMCASNLI